MNPFPPKQQSIPSMPTMNPMGGIPTNPNPQPQQIPMGMGIPQSPAGQSSQAMNDEVNAMIQNVFNGGNGLM